MRKFLISIAIASTALAAVPALAQNNGHRGAYNQGRGIEARLDHLEDRIDRARDRRMISNQEARKLSFQAEQIDRLHDRYRRNGLTGWERQDLNRRLDMLQQRLRFDRRDNNRR